MKPSEDLTKGIVQILRNDSTVSGTGFIIYKNLIATCAHVVQEAGAAPGDRIKVRFNIPDGKESSTFVIPERWRSVEKGDLSILQLEEELPSDVEVLSIGSSAGISGHKVSTFGFPVTGDIKGIWGQGEVLGKVTERGNSLLQIDSNEITAGFSGAPLWDESRQRVIGIVVGTVRQDLFGKLQNVAFAIPSEVLQSISPELKIQDISPYRGLFSFKEDDEFLFFGRTKLVQELKKQLQTYPRFLAVVGSSGSGKSSLIFAGLLPRIQRGEIVGFENVHVVTFRPNDISKPGSASDTDPEESLRQALQRSGVFTEKADLWDGISSYLERKPEIRLVIYADQFETLFANANEATQVEFLQGIYGLLKSNLKITFLLTVRGDYYEYLMNSLLGEYLSDGQVNVRSMSEEEMKEAIDKPADVTGLKIEKGLEDLIINDLKNTKNSLPLLEFTLTKLWESRSEGVLTHEAYIKIGGASGAIGQWANETYNSLSTEEKELARKIFTRLIHYGEGDLPDSRRRLSLDELAGGSDEQAVHRLIKKLADAHILVTDRELSKGTETVEIIHDSVLSEWKQLSKWISEQRGFLTWRQTLEERMDEWNRNKDEGNLLRGAPLVEAKAWLVKYNEGLNPDEIKYIKESSELADRERVEKERSRNRIIKGLAAFSIIVLILAGFATYQWYQTEQQKQQVRVSSLNAKSQNLQEYPGVLDKSILLAIESFRVSETLHDERVRQNLSLDADKIIRQGLLSIPHRVVFLNNDGPVNNVVFSPDEKYVATASYDNKARLWDAPTGKQIFFLNHNGPVNNVAFSPDGKYVATASYDNTASLWNTSTGKQIFVLNHDSWVNNVVFSRDGKYVATASHDNTSRLWDVATGKQVFVLNHDDGVNNVVFSPDGKYIATASNDTTARLWDAATGREIFVLKNYGWVNNVVFSPDGKYVASASADNTARLWDAATGKQIFVLNHESQVNNVVFSPDGKYVATASVDFTARLWDAATGKQIFALNHEDHVLDVIFSRDGKYVVTASRDTTARVWDAATGDLIFVLNHDSWVYDVVFSPDGKYIATASKDNTARLWDAATEVMKHNGPVYSVVFSPDGKFVATASADNTSRLWDTATGKQIFVLKHYGWVYDVVFSPDGKYVATASKNNTAGLWDAATGKQIFVLNHDGWVLDVNFSPDGKYVATCGGDTVRLWDAATGKQIFVLNHTKWVNNVVFSPDGKYVASASADTTARLWDATTSKEIFVLNHSDRVQNVVFSPDGKYVATASFDSTARLWDAYTGKQIHNLKHNHLVNRVVFSPDGNYIATASGDKTARLWDVATGKEIFVLKHDSSMNNVVFSPDGKYIATASDDNTARLWDVSAGKQIFVMNHDSPVDNVQFRNVVFSPDGKYVATASGDNTRLWIQSKTEDLINEASNRLTRNFSPEEWKEYMGDEPYHKTFPNLP